LSEFILQTNVLSKAFGGLVALDKLDLAIEESSITAVIGPNGAGKTTLFNLIAGVYPATSGEILFQGKRINSIPAHKRASLGIARTFQHSFLFGNMTVLENIMTGQHIRSHYGILEAALCLPRSYREEREIFLEATKYLNLVGLGMEKDREALSLPLGRQKLLAIARALATEPKILLLDEPGAGLTTLEKRSLSDLIHRIIDMGITVLLVEHDMPLVMGLAEKVIVLDSGQKIAEGSAAQIQRDKRVIAVYLGEEVDV
jgi:branched-chain amino acid transport system ATP-binding protein